MEIFTIFILAIGLSFDSFAVSVSSGLVLPEFKLSNLLKISFSLALFQGGMPVIGWLCGFLIKDLITEIDHWVALILLTFIGLRMIISNSGKKKEDKIFDPLKLSILIGLSIATSIDALVVGVNFGLLKTNIILAAVIICIITFLISFAGIIIGYKTGKHFGKSLEIIGGIILICIGLKIFIEHQFIQ